MLGLNLPSSSEPPHFGYPQRAADRLTQVGVNSHFLVKGNIALGDLPEEDSTLSWTTLTGGGRHRYWQSVFHRSGPCEAPPMALHSHAARWSVSIGAFLSELD